MGGAGISLQSPGNITITNQINVGNMSVGVSTGCNNSGTTGTVSNQLIFCGGSNITLSESISGQSATITIIGASGGGGGSGIFSGGVSTDGNSYGTTGIVSQQLIFVGGTNISLSQSINGQSGTITIIGASGGGGGSGIFSGGVSNLGNTAGTTGTVSNELVFVGGTNITLSQSINGQSGTITINGPAFTQSTQPSLKAGVSSLGNTAGTTGTVSNQLVFVGGSNITLSESINGQSVTITIKGASIPGQSVQSYNILSAGSQVANTSGTVLFQNSNNVSFGMSNNSVITASASFNQSIQTQSTHVHVIAGNTTGTTASMSTGTLTLAGGNNITLSQVGNAVTISGPNTVAQSVQPSLSAGVSTDGNTAGTTGIVSQQLIFVGGTNITLSQSINANSATITIEGASIAGQSIQSYNILAAGTQTANTSGTVLFQNSNNVSFGMSDNSVITASASFSQSVQTESAHVHGVSGNTFGTGTALMSTGTIVIAGGNNITLSQDANSVTISGPNTFAQSIQPGIQSLSAGTTNITTGEVVFSNSNNISFGANGQTITASASFSQSIQTESTHVHIIGGNTTGTTASMSTGTIEIFGGNNITLSQNANSVTISAANQSLQTQSIIIDVNIGGNTSGTTSDISSGTLVLAGGYNITLSQVGNTITFSGPEQITAVVSDLGNTAGLTGAPAKMDQLVFVGGNNITLSQTYVGEDVTITINGLSQSIQTSGLFDLTIGGNTTGTGALISSGTLTLVGGNSITLSQNGGNAITIIGSQSQQTDNIIREISIGGNTSGTLALISSGTMSLIGGYNITLVQDANTITINGPEQLTAVVSDLGNTAGLTGAPIKMDQLVFVGGNNITLSQTYVGEDVTITINGLSQSLQTQNIVRDVNIIGNTSGTTADITSGTMYLAGGNDIVLFQNGNSITISATGPLTAGMSNIGNTSGTTGPVHDLLVLVGGNNVTLSQSTNLQSATLTISGPNMFSAGESNLGNELGTSGAVSQLLVLVGGNNITLSQSVTAGSATLTISGANQTLQTSGLFDLTIGGNTTGTGALISSGTMTLAGGANITLSQNAGNAITIYGASQTLQTSGLFDLTLAGNTTGTLALVSSGTMTLAGGNNITLSQDGYAITISGPNTVAQSVQPAVNIGAGTQTATSGTVIFSNSNNFTFGMSNNSVITASFLESQQTQNIIREVSILGVNTAGTLTDITSGTLYLAGGANITLSQEGNSITISAGSAAVGSFSAGISTFGNTAGTTGFVKEQFLFVGSNNITLSQSVDGQSATLTIIGATLAGGSFGAGVSDLGNTLGTTGTVSQQMIFVGGNNITLSQSIDGNSATLTINAFSQTVQTGNLFDLTISGNTTGTGALISSGTLTLAGGNNITLSQSGNAITISGASQSAQTGSIVQAVVIAGNTSGTTASISSGTLQLAGGYGITLSQNQNSITISGGEQLTAVVSDLGNTAGLTGAPAIMDQLVFVGGNNITLSQTYVGEDVTITISGANQTLQTSGLFDLTIGGNTTGTGALVSSGTLFLAGGNGIILSQDGNSITISGHEISAGMSTLGNTSGTTGLVHDQLVFVGGNNVTLSQSVNLGSATLTISGPNMFSAGVSNIGNTLGSTGPVSQLLVFVGGNNITLSESSNAGSGTITISAPNQSVQTESRFNLTIGGNTTGTGALISSGVLTLAGGNNITISQSGGNAITIYGASQTLQTSNLFDLTLSGNTTGTMALISSGTMTLAGGYNITLSQAGNAVTIYGPEQLTAVVSNLGNTAGTTGAPTKMDQLIFVGGSNITLSQSIGTGASSEDVTITIIGASQSAQTGNLFDLTLSGNTTGTLALVSSGTLTLAGGNNITLSQVGNAITISGASQTLQTSNLFDLTLSGNTTGTLALVSSGTMTLAGGNNITLSQVGNAITISGHPLYSAGMSNLGNSAGTTGVADNRLIIVGGSNISISQSLDALSNFGTITINGPNTQSQSVQTSGLFDLTLSGNTSGTLALVSSGTLTLAGGNNITLSQVGNAITISGPNTVAQSIQTQSTHVHVIAGNTTGTTASMSTGTIQLAGGNSITLSQNGNSVTISGPQFSNSNNISFGVNAGIITASASFSQSVQTQSTHVHVIAGNTSGTTVSMSTGTLTLAGGNNITLSQVGNAVTISGPNTVSQSVQTGNLFDLTISGNTTGTGALISSGTLTLAGGANITLSQNGNAITIIGASAGSGGGGVAIANSQTTFSSGTVNLLEGGGAITIASSAGGQSLMFSVPATSSLVQSGNVSIITAGSTITISGMGIGSLGVVGSTNTFTSGNVIFSGVANITLSTSVSDGSQYILISAPAPGGGATLSRWEYPHGAFLSLGATGQGSYSLEHMYVPFNVTATMMRIGGSLSASTNTSATTASVNYSLCMGIYTLNGSTLSLASSGSANNGFRWSQSASTTANTSVNSMRQMTVPININMTPGEYWVGAVLSFATTYTAVGFTMYGDDAINTLATGAQLAPIGSGTTAGRPAIFWQGIYTAATSACPVAISTNGINFSSASNANRANFHLMMANATYGII